MACCEISDLSDEDLAEIFKRLPPYDRLLTSLVCKRWHRINSMAWLDLTNLDLSPISASSIGAIIKRSPNLHIVSAAHTTFHADALRSLSRANLSAVKLYNCTVFISCKRNNIPDALRAILSSRLRTASWEELVLHDLETTLQPNRRQQVQFPVTFLPISLKRLQLSGVNISSGCFDSRSPYGDHTVLRGLGQLRELECLMLHGTHRDHVISIAIRTTNILDEIVPLQNLCELYLSDLQGRHCNLARMLMRLSRLRVLFLHNVCTNIDHFDLLAAKHPSLRILAFTGSFASAIDFPARLLYGNGLNAHPLPQLHIFVGKFASEKIRFPKFPSNAAKVYSISEPLPVFLQRAEVKQIFEGVWIAEKIKEAAKEGATLYDYTGDVATVLRTIDST